MLVRSSTMARRILASSICLNASARTLVRQHWNHLVITRRPMRRLSDRTMRWLSFSAIASWEEHNTPKNERLTLIS